MELYPSPLRWQVVMLLHLIHTLPQFSPTFNFLLHPLIPRFLISLIIWLSHGLSLACDFLLIILLSNESSSSVLTHAPYQSFITLTLFLLLKLTSPVSWFFNLVHCSSEFSLLLFSSFLLIFLRLCYVATSFSPLSTHFNK